MASTVSSSVSRRIGRKPLQSQSKPPSKLPMVVGILAIVVTVAGMTALIVSASSRRGAEYRADSPDDLVRSAVMMIRNGEAEKLPTLFYAETPEMGSIFKRLGGLLGSMQDLGSAVNKRFPAEVAKLREEAKKKVAESDPAATIASALIGSRGLRRPAARPGQSEQLTIEEAAKAIFADPFGWLDRNSDRLSTTMVSDDQAAVLFDGKPLPPFGLSLRFANQRWYIELPLRSIPGVSQVMPQTRHEYSIFGHLMRVLDTAIGELADDVRAGRVAHMGKLAERAGEKAFGPAVMVFIVYGKEMDVRQRRDRAMTAFRKRLNAWYEERKETFRVLGDDRERRLRQTIDKVAIEELDQLVRIDTTRASREDPRSVPAFVEQSTADFELTLGEWFARRGAKVQMSNLVGPDLDKALDGMKDAPRLKPSRRSKPPG